MKLLFVLVVTGFFVVLLVGLLFKIFFDSSVHKLLEKNIINYADYIIQDIGVPPDTLRAKQIANEFAIEIRYESPGFVWTTSPDSPTIDEVGKQRRHQTHSPRWWAHENFVITNPDGSRFLFYSNMKNVFKMPPGFIFGFLFFLILILTATHFFIRQILKPVRWLTEGALQIGDGNFDYRIPVRQHDELGRLSNAFNDMTQRIKEMIQARDQLLLDVSHELRSPITRMKVALEFLSTSKEKKNLQDDISEMETMITEILESERFKNGHGKLDLKEHNISQLIREVTENYKNMPPGVQLKNIPKSINLKIDFDRIRIVLKNIIENAIKYSTPESKPVQFFLKPENKNIIVQVLDDGPGISEEHLPYLFEPFYRVDKSRSKKTGGYGLGLSLCKKIMEAHGGKIEIFNNEVSGMTVQLTFLFSS
ncbi:HAMP domain-containing histidine kinase [candidate division KSB1 bacterium]|nr:HAMP domain-containing histidine kinase [candidate division KSB1 bacterium]MBL7094022.1 HAMP domain-containing histidine kinase [candidate division KSB1 bacterium]